MNSIDRKKHWENVYETKTPDQVSWTQEIPQTSLNFIRSFNLPKTAKIIDIGGGDSKLVDFLLEQGYENVTVLDISSKAIERAKQRLGSKSQLITWVVSDITEFEPSTQYDVWHDRAAFHFLTTPEQKLKYIDIASKTVIGYMVIGTFSETGPLKCSGLEINRYNEISLPELFEQKFEKLNCITENHSTPFNTIQNFLFCGLKYKG